MLSSPPRDTDGLVEPHDHDEIAAAHGIIRRVNPDEHVVFDANRNRRRLSSKLMQPSSEPKGGMSVDHEPTIVELGYVPTDFVVDPPFLGSVLLTAGAIRQIGLRIGYDPIEPGNLAHCEVWGSQQRPNYFTKGQQNQLLNAMDWHVALVDIELR